DSCHLDTTHHPDHVVAADTMDTMAVEVGTADNTDHTVAEHNQVGYTLPAVERCKPQPCAQTLPGTCPSDMTASILSIAC
ncbi:hypothetical protein Tco_0372762, partial [Tanacetum coccineum]